MHTATLAIPAVCQWVSQSVSHSLCNTLWHHMRWIIFTIEKYFWNIFMIKFKHWFTIWDEIFLPLKIFLKYFQLKTIKRHFYSQLERFQPCFFLKLCCKNLPNFLLVLHGQYCMCIEIFLLNLPTLTAVMYLMPTFALKTMIT